MLSLSISCKKTTSEVAPTEKNCLIQKISYNDGNYEVYKLNANNRMASTIITYEDNGKFIKVPLRYEYNAAENLLKQ